MESSQKPSSGIASSSSHGASRRVSSHSVGWSVPSGMPAVACGSARAAAMADDLASKVGGTLGADGCVVLAPGVRERFRAQRPLPFAFAVLFGRAPIGVCREGLAVVAVAVLWVWPGRGCWQSLLRHEVLSGSCILTPQCTHSQTGTD